MDAAAIRQRSIQSAARLGYPVSPALPLLDTDVRLRSSEDVIDRCLALYIAVAVSYGFSRQAAKNWMEREGLSRAQAPSEHDFLEGADGSALQHFQDGVEALFAFVWALDMFRELDFGSPCPDTLIKMLPDLKTGESKAGFVKSARLRSLEEVIEAGDLAYCLHWSLMQAALEGTSLLVGTEPYVIVERRRALEWMISDDPWDELTLDT